MSKFPSMRLIRSQVRTKRYLITKHATTVRLERRITIAEMERALLNAKSLRGIQMTSHTHLVLCWVGLFQVMRYTSFVRGEKLNQRCVL